MTTYAIVYATASKMIRRVIADDDGMVSVGTMLDGFTPAVLCTHHNGQPTSYHPLAAGESALVHVPPSAITPANPAIWQQVVLAATGVTPPVIICALIDGTNTVQQIIYADPAIDVAPNGFTLVQCYSPQICVGYTFDPVGRLFTQPSCTIPANSPGNQTASPVVMSAAVIPNTGTPV